MVVNKKNNKKKRFIKSFLTSLIIFGTIFVFGYSLLNKIENKYISNDDEMLGITEESTDSKNTVNILLFGLDCKDASSRGRSDSIMIATLDKKHKKIKLTSLMRDTYVDIPGKGMDKLNHAYSFGGPELAIRTVNQNFNMNIRDFAAVDFAGFEKIVDIMGGVEIDVKPNEVEHVKNSVAGPQLLNGQQALDYSRIRKTGNGDYERTERQRFVLEQVFKKGLDAGLTRYPQLLNAMLPHVETSLSKPKMLTLGTSVIVSGLKDIDQYRIPVDGHGRDQKINGVYYLIPETLEDNIMFLNKFIYEDEKN